MYNLEREKRERAKRAKANAVGVIAIAAIFAAGCATGYGISKATAGVKEIEQELTSSEGVMVKLANVPTYVRHTADRVLLSADAEDEETAAFYPLSDEERAIVESVVMAEASGEGYDGQRLVAQCILNGCLRDGTPPSVTVVEYQYAKSRPEPSESVKDAVSAVFDRHDVVTDEPILYFYAPDRCESAWHESLDLVVEYGGHRFFKIPEE